MFEREIERDIRGVIKADQTSDEDVYQELNEYVVTKELHKHFSKFYENYLKGIDGQSDKVGVWISGFFGSGKSHFLKILSYLLENKSLKDIRPTDFFEGKIQDPIVLANMNRTANIPTETILFNIDAKSPLDNKAKEDAILRVLLKVFYDHQGYYGDNLVVAELEKYLDKEGYLEKFHEAYEAAASEPWINRRNSFYFDGHFIKEALLKSTPMTEDSIDNWLAHSIENIEISIEKFARDVKEYIDTKEPNFHLVFLIDEVGQYIGDRRDLMLNLQTVTENLGAICHGQAWMMVTSQESIDTIVKVKGDDFSRIQGRFDTRLSMSSISVDEVIQKRILEKKEYVQETLKAIYPKKGAILSNVISFKDCTADLRGFEDEAEFADVYPFIPYQFKLLQNVFEQVRRHGSSGKHLSEGERSMLSAYREAGIRFMEEEQGRLIPFHAFYDTIREFLQPTVSRVIEGAAENSALKDDKFNIDLLKVLFMIKYVKELPANIDNIATLMVSHIDEDKLELKEKINVSLRKLINQTLIQKNGQHYLFLTDDEQDINREIKAITIEEDKVKRMLAENIFDGFYATKKYSYSKMYDFSFNQVMDEKNYGNQSAQMGINIISPLSEYYHESEQRLSMMTSGTNQIIVRLDSGSYIEEIEETLKIDEYRNSRNTNQLPENIQNILNNKQAEIRERRRRANDFLEEALKNARFFMLGNEFDVKGSTIKEKIDGAFKLLVENIYTYLPYVKEFIANESELKAYIASTNEQTGLLDTVDAHPNMEAKRAIESHIGLQVGSNVQVRVKPLYDRFCNAPYGWRYLDVAGSIAELLKDAKIRISYNAEFLELGSNTNQLMTVFTKTSESDKAIITIRKKVDESLIRNVKSIGQELFNRSIQAHDEDELKVEIRQLMDTEMNLIKQYKAKYAKSEYPGLSLLNKGEKYFSQFNNSLDNLSFFNLFVELEDDLGDWFEDIEDVKNFFDTNHISIFNGGLVATEKYNEIRSYIESEEVNEAMVKLNDILANPIPYNHIKLIPQLVEVFETEINRLLESKKGETKVKITANYAEATLLVKRYDVTDNTRKSAKEHYEELIKELEVTENIFKVDAIVTLSQNYLTRLIKIVESEIRAAREARVRERKEDDGNVINEPITEPVVQKEEVKLSNLINIQTLKTEEDVDEYINVLSNKLKQIIKSNKEIEFIE